MMRAWILLGVLTVGCGTKTSAPAADAKAGAEADAGARAETKAEPDAAAQAAAQPAAKAEPDAAAAAPSIGSVALVIERVDISAGGCGSKGPLGYDLRVETKLDVEEKKASRPHLFCPPGKKDMYEMCKRFRSCKAEAADAGTATRTSVTCDGETYVLEVGPEGGRVTGKGVDKVVAPPSFRLEKPRSITRVAYVDC